LRVIKTVACGMQTSHDLQRAKDYRARAAEMTRQAASTQDTSIKAGYLDIASTYLRMAEHIEKDIPPSSK
jgi:hypothetical protein